jgi:hypothetical protein
VFHATQRSKNQRHGPFLGFLAPPSPTAEQILKIVEEIRDLLVRQRPEKDKYTVPEAATILGKRPFTVREWCRLGR